MSEHRKYINDILKEELGPLYIGIPGLYKAFFGGVKGLKKASTVVFKKYKEGDNLLYTKSSWHDWPKSTKQDNVLKWFNSLIRLFLDFVAEHGPALITQQKLVIYTE